MRIFALILFLITNITFASAEIHLVLKKGTNFVFYTIGKTTEFPAREYMTNGVHIENPYYIKNSDIGSTLKALDASSFIVNFNLMLMHYDERTDDYQFGFKGSKEVLLYRQSFPIRQIPGVMTFYENQKKHFILRGKFVPPNTTNYKPPLRGYDPENDIVLSIDKSKNLVALVQHDIFLTLDLDD